MAEPPAPQPMESEQKLPNGLKELPMHIEAGGEVEEFANAFDDCLAPHIPRAERIEKLFALPSVYYDITLRRLDQLRSNRRDDADVDMYMDDPVPEEASVEIAELEKEAQTLDLLRRVLPLQYEDRSDLTASSTGNIMHDFLETDPLARERCAILQWLQHNASSGPDIDELTEDLQQNADRGDIIAHGWLHTRSTIKLRKGVAAWPHLLDKNSSAFNSLRNADNAPLVSQLDPDAATRQGRNLEPKDDYFERAIWLGCFEHLRRGSSMETIREWCQERTEMWRAISMSAMPLSSDEDQANVPPTSLALWRRMCYSLARNGGSDDYERAVYGLLSGDINSVTKVAKTWDDCVFASYNALLRTQLDNYVLGQCTRQEAASLTNTFPSFDAVQYLGDGEGVGKRLIQSLESRADIRSQALEPNKALQAAFIAGDLGTHLAEQGEALLLDPRIESSPAGELSRLLKLSNQGEKYFKLEQYDGLRIMAHIYLILHALGRKTPESIELRYRQETIIAAYADFLRRAKLFELIPMYCSLVDEQRGFEILAGNLVMEEAQEKKKMLLRLVHKAEINVPRFVAAQAHIMYAKAVQGPNPTPEFSIFINPDDTEHPVPKNERIVPRYIRADFIAQDNTYIPPNHECLVRSLEWMQGVMEVWPQVFSMGTKAYTYFLKHQHLAVARELKERVSYATILQDLVRHEDIDALPVDNVNFWTEQLEESEIGDAQPEAVMADARNFRELEALVKALDSLETIGSMVTLAREARTQPGVVDEQLRNFRDLFTEAVDKCKANMVPLLHRWLLSGIEEGNADLLALREMYLPEVLIGYVVALHHAGTVLSKDWLLECMELASVVARRDSDLTGTIQKAGRMKELLDAFAAASKTLAIKSQEKRGPAGKKLRERGWNRDIWSVRS